MGGVEILLYKFVAYTCTFFFFYLFTLLHFSGNLFVFFFGNRNGFFMVTVVVLVGSISYSATYIGETNCLRITNLPSPSPPRPLCMGCNWRPN